MRLLLEGCKKNDRGKSAFAVPALLYLCHGICVRYSRSFEGGKRSCERWLWKCTRKLISMKPNRPSRDAEGYDQFSHRSLSQGIETQNHVEASADKVLGPTWELHWTTSLSGIDRHDSDLSPAYRAVFNLHVIDGFTRNFKHIEYFQKVLQIKPRQGRETSGGDDWSRQTVKALIPKTCRDKELDNLFRGNCRRFYSASEDPSAWQQMSMLDGAPG